MNQRHGFDPVAAFAEGLARLGILDGVGLQVQQAGNDLQVVLDPMVNLLDQDFFFLQRGLEVLFDTFALGDVPRNGRNARDLPRDVRDGGNGQRDGNLPAVFTQVYGFVMFDTFAPPHAFEEAGPFLGGVWGNEDADGATDDFLAGIAVDALRCEVPTHDRTVQSFAHDRVGGRLHDGGQVGDSPRRAFALGNVPHKPGEHGRAFAGDPGEAQLNGEFRAIAPQRR